MDVLEVDKEMPRKNLRYYNKYTHVNQSNDELPKNKENSGQYYTA